MSLHLSRWFSWFLALGLVLASTPEADAGAARRGTPSRIRRPYKPGSRAIGAAPIVSFSGDRFVSEAEYVELRRNVVTLLERYSPRDHFFIGLGRDPTPIMAFLHQLGGDELAMNFPASGSGTWSYDHSRPSDAVVEPYFEKLIPPHVLAGDRDIVVVDQTSGGRTLRGFPPVLQRYLDKVGFKGRLIKVAFSDQAQDAGIDRIDTSRSPIVTSFLGSPYEGAFSEYPRHVIGASDPDDLRKLPEYRRYQKALARRMAGDRALDLSLGRIDGGGRVGQARWRPKLSLAFEPGAGPGPDHLFSLAEPHSYYENDITYLDGAEYDSLRDVALGLMHNAPPRESFYLGVGQSSGPIVTFLENLGSSVVAYLPADGPVDLVGGQRPAKVRKDLYALFDRVVPRAALTGGRSLVLFQAVDEDLETLELVKKILRQYLRVHHSDTEVSVVALASYQPASGHRYVDTSDVYPALDDDKFVRVAPYPAFQPGHAAADGPILRPDGRLVRRGRDHGKLKRGMTLRMKHDHTLEALLPSLFGSDSGSIAR
jgi:hypothetical protein